MKLLLLSALVAVCFAETPVFGGGYAGGHARGHFGGHARGHFGGHLGGHARGHAGGHFGGHARGHFGGYNNVPYDAGHGSIDYYSPPDYSNGYQIADRYSGVNIGQSENRLGQKTEGSYSVALPDGRIQRTTYWVDGPSGYNAKVEYLGQAVHPAPGAYH